VVRKVKAAINPQSCFLYWLVFLWVYWPVTWLRHLVHVCSRVRVLVVCTRFATATLGLVTSGTWISKNSWSTSKRTMVGQGLRNEPSGSERQIQQMADVNCGVMYDGGMHRPGVEKCVVSTTPGSGCSRV
jgi:hypothetical protein